MGTVIVVLILAVIVFFAIRAVLHGNTGGCSGDCSKCGSGCHHHKN